MKILITGGAGFIGSALIRYFINNSNHQVINVDRLSIGSCLDALNDVINDTRYFFEQVDICDYESTRVIFEKHKPDAVMHLAAESHVDRSIEGPLSFVKVNVLGTANLLEVARAYYNKLPELKKNIFRFHHISTDEVYGDLGSHDLAFTEHNAYEPSSPYSASKASSDHLVRSWHRTFGLPVLITNCSNNYGMYQNSEKLIPCMIKNALLGKPLPIYGDGLQIRDWLFVDDHVRALQLVLESGRIGETYNIGGNSELKNIDVVNTLCFTLDRLVNKKPRNINSFRELITFVTDRLGHDRRYAVNSDKIKNELQWQPLETFEGGVEKTVAWYLANMKWLLASDIDESELSLSTQVDVKCNHAVIDAALPYLDNVSFTSDAEKSVVQNNK